MLVIYIQCPFLLHENGKHKCSITYYNVNDNKCTNFCSKHSEDCNLRLKRVHLHDNEYTYGYIEGNKPIPGKIFVNNIGTRFLCRDSSIIKCPICKNDICIHSFDFGIVCHSCGVQVH